MLSKLQQSESLLAIEIIREVSPPKQTVSRCLFTT